MYNFEEVLSFLRANQDMAGWAQAAGAIVGIAIAILIPAYQRYAQTLDAKRQGSVLRLNYDLGVFYLLGDVKNWLEAQNNGANYPRWLNFTESARDELLKRILMFEGSAIEHESVAALFRARGAILNTNLALTHRECKDMPLSIAETKLLEDRINMVKKYEDSAQEKMGNSFDELYRLRLFLIARLIYPIIKYAFGGFIKTRASRRKMAEKISEDLVS